MHVFVFILTSIHFLMTSSLDPNLPTERDGLTLSPIFYLYLSIVPSSSLFPPDNYHCCLCCLLLSGISIFEDNLSKHAYLNCDFLPSKEFLPSYKNKISYQLWNNACSQFPDVWLDSLVKWLITTANHCTVYLRCILFCA